MDADLKERDLKMVAMQSQTADLAKVINNLNPMNSSSSNTRGCGRGGRGFIFFRFNKIYSLIMKHTSFF